MEQIGEYLFEELIFLLAAIIIGYFYFYWRKKRNKSYFKELSTELNLCYSKKRPAIIDQCSHLDYFKNSKETSFHNSLIGSNEEFEFCVSDVTHQIPEGEPYNSVVLIIKSEKLLLPQFFLRTKTFLLDRLQRWFEPKGVLFEDDPGFSKRFYLSGDHEFRLKRFFSRSIRAALKEHKIFQMHLMGHRDVLMLEFFSIPFYRNYTLEDMEKEARSLFKILSHNGIGDLVQ